MSYVAGARIPIIFSLARCPELQTKQGLELGAECTPSILCCLLLADGLDPHVCMGVIQCFKGFIASHNLDTSNTTFTSNDWTYFKVAVFKLLIVVHYEKEMRKLATSLFTPVPPPLRVDSDESDEYE